MGKMWLIALFVVLAPSMSFAGTQTYTSPGTYSFTVPAFQSLTVQVWGGGGGGGNYVHYGSAGGNSSFAGVTGGGGNPGGPAAATTGGPGGGAYGGGTNTIGNPGTYDWTWKYGTGGAAPNGGAGGSGSTYTGYSGGIPGGGGGSPVRGSGGGSAGYASATWNAGGLTAGSAVTVVVGAGGAGAPTTDGYTSGAGGAGRVSISWTDAPPASCTLSLDASSISSGSGTYLRWSSQHANEWVYITNIGYVGASGAVWVAPGSTTTYSCGGQGTGGSTGWVNVTLTVISNAPTCTIWSDKNPKDTNESVQLRWTSTNATSFHISGVGYVTPNQASNALISPTVNTMYNGSVSGAGGSATCTYGQVVQPPPPTGLTHSCSADGTTMTFSWNPVPGAERYSPRISPPTGGTCPSGWVLSGSPQYCVPNPDVYPHTSVANYPVTPGQTYFWWVHSWWQSYLTPAGVWSGPASAYATCAATASAPTCALSVSPNQVAPGNTATLSWSSSNATSCSSNNFTIPNGTTRGSQSVSPAVTTTYTASCTGPGGTTQCQSATLSTSCTQGYSCTGAGGQTITRTNADCSTTTINTCVAPQYCSPGSASCLSPGISGTIRARPALVSSGATTVVSWSTSNAMSCTVSGGGLVWTGTSGSQTSSSITVGTKFVLVCDDSDPDSVEDDFTAEVTVGLVPSWREG